MIRHHVQRIQRQSMELARLVDINIPASTQSSQAQQRRLHERRRQPVQFVARLTRQLSGSRTRHSSGSRTRTLCSATPYSGSRPVIASVSGRPSFHTITPRSFFSTSPGLTEDGQTLPYIAIPKRLGGKMFQHILGPDGKVQGMRSLLGEEAKDNEVIVQDNPLPMFLGKHFIAFVSGINNLPNNRKSAIPPLTKEEFQLLLKPYSQWAPAPFNETITPLDSAFVLFMHSTCFSGFPDLSDMESLISTPFEGLSFMEQEAHFNKMRAWAGLVPLSERRWKEKGLHQGDSIPGGPPKNLMKAMDHLDKTMDTFLYWSMERTVDKLRTSYNKAYDHLVKFDNALAAYYAQTPSRRPGNEQRKAADHWAEYFFSHIQFMTDRAHTWYTEKVTALQDHIVQEISSKPLPKGGMILSTEQEAALEKLKLTVGRRSSADINLLIPLTGFRNNLPHWQQYSSPPFVDWTRDYLNSKGSRPLPGPHFPEDIIMRGEVHKDRRAYLLRQKKAAIPPRISDSALWTSEDSMLILMSGQEANDQARYELRGCPPAEITEELWITHLREILERPPRSSSSSAPTFTKWGWVAYRLDYSHTPEEWSRFLDAFNAEVLDGWDQGVKGASHVKSKAHIQWLDGRDFGIAENDLHAARAHFQSLKDSKSPLIQGLITPSDAFLVADEPSINSFLHPLPEFHPDPLDMQEDTKPIIRIAQAKYDPATMEDHTKKIYNKEAPGYTGELDVAGCVLMDDMWPSLFMSLHAGLYSFWPIAAAHPGHIYLGPYANYQEKTWGLLKKMMGEATEGSQNLEQGQVLTDENQTGR